MFLMGNTAVHHRIYNNTKLKLISLNANHQNKHLENF